MYMDEMFPSGRLYNKQSQYLCLDGKQRDGETNSGCDSSSHQH